MFLILQKFISYHKITDESGNGPKDNNCAMLLIIVFKNIKNNDNGSINNGSGYLKENKYIMKNSI